MHGARDKDGITGIEERPINYVINQLLRVDFRNIRVTAP